MQTIVYKGENYVSGKQVVDQLIHFFNGYENPRKFVTKSDVSKDKYVVLRYDTENKVYKEGEKYSPKLDKVWFKTDYYNEIREINKKMVEDEEELLLKTPGKLLLEDEEKFKNDKGIILEIETIGERQVDKIFFNADDIADQFKSPNLKKDIVREESSFVENTDYVFFTFRDGKKIKQRMYLTHAGFTKYIEVRRSSFSENNKKIVRSWLNMFNTTKIKTYKLSIENDIIKSKIGYVYCITSHVSNCVKIGRWRKSIEGLRSRYITYYGNKLEIYFYKTADYIKLEKKTHKHFEMYNIEQELFEKEYLEEYISYIEENVEEYDESIEKDNIFEYEDVVENIDIDENDRKIKHGKEIEKQKIEYEEKLQQQKEHYEEIIKNKEIESRKKLKRQKNKYEELMDRQQEKHESEMDLKESDHKLEMSKMEPKYEKENSDNVNKLLISENKILKMENEMLKKDMRIDILEKRMLEIESENDILKNNVEDLSEKNKKLKKKIKSVKNDE